MTKKAEQAMDYEVAGNTKPSKGSTRRYIEKEMDNLGITAVAWYMVKRCRLGISISLNLLFVYIQFHKVLG